MKVKARTNRARIELLPLLDMIFLVLVSFVYSFISMTYQRGIPVELPFAQSAVKNETEHVIITVKTDSIYINKDEIKENDFENYLISITDTVYEPSVYISAEKNVHYDRFISVLDRVRQSGLNRISIKTSVTP